MQHPNSQTPSSYQSNTQIDTHINTQISDGLQQLISEMLPEIDAKRLWQLFTSDAFSQLPAHTLQQHTWKKGSLLFEHHKTFADFVLIKTGLVRSFYIEHSDDNSYEVNLRFLGDKSAALPFTAVAEHWLTGKNLHQQIHKQTSYKQASHKQQQSTSKLLASESIQCITDVVGYRLPLNLFDQPTQFSQNLKATLAMRHYISIEQRLRMLKMPKAADRYACFKKTLDACIVDHMPNYHIASYLGMTPETLSRLKQRMQ